MKRIISRVFSLLLALIMLYGAAAPALAADPASITLSSPALRGGELWLDVGYQRYGSTLTATVDPEIGAGEYVTWSTSESRSGVAESERYITVTPSSPTTATISVNKRGSSAGSVDITVYATVGATESSCLVKIPFKPVTEIDLDAAQLSIPNGRTATLTATVYPLDATQRGVIWTSDRPAVAAVQDNGDGTATITAMSSGTAQIEATTVEGGHSTYCIVTVGSQTSVDEIQLPQTISIVSGTSKTLTAVVLPEDATDRRLQWSVDRTDLLTITTRPDDASQPLVSSDPAVTITAGTPSNSVETARITVRAMNGRGLATCDVRVTRQAFEVASVKVDQGEFLLEVGEGRDLTATVDPSYATNQTLIWTGGRSTEAGDYEDDTADTKVARRVVSVNPDTGVITAVAPGKTTIRVTAGGTRAIDGVTGDVTATGGVTSLDTDSCQIVVSGLTVKPDRFKFPVGGNTTVRPTKYGDAESVLLSEFEWSSSNTSIARVNIHTGEVTGVGAGRVTITYTGGNYSASCTVEVTTDGDGNIDAQSYYSNGQLNFSSLVTKLRTTGSEMTLTDSLQYITGLSVPTNQGTLYDHYVAEPNTGDGISSSTRYYISDNINLISNVYFVPKPGYSGNVTISYTGYTTNGAFSGEIRLTVSADQAALSALTYRINQGETVRFSAADFNNYCDTLHGRNLSYIVFTLPEERYGTLRYNDLGDGLYERALTANTRYYRSSSPSIDDVYFVPQSGAGTVDLRFSYTDSSGTTYSTGRVRIIIADGDDSGNSSEVSYTTSAGQRVYFNAGDFNDACYDATKGLLNYIRLNSTPASSRGTLYYNNSRAATNVSYFRSGSSSQRLIDDLSFVPSGSYSGTFTLSYTGTSTYGETFTGAIRITVTSSGASALSYSVPSGGRLELVAGDFNSASTSATGTQLNYITFPTLPSSARGTLYYNYNTRVTAGTAYYRANSSSYSSSRMLISDLSFVPASGFTGTVAIPFTGYNTNGRSFTGSLSISVGSSYTAPVSVLDPNASLSYTSNGLAVAFRPSDFISDATEKLPYTLTTVRFSTPSPSEGRLCLDYVSPTHYEPLDGTVNFPVRSLSRISFQPKGGFSGTARISFTGTDTTGKSYGGIVMVHVTPSAASTYFSDMGGHRWAVPAVDFLRIYGYVNGTGDRTFSPAAETRRGDFILMLSRAFSFPLAGTDSFSDVPPGQYYAAAIAAAKTLGVAAGDETGRFRPDATISRQEAAVFLYRAMKRSGSTPAPDNAVLAAFTDRDRIAPYALDAMASLVQLGVFQGDDLSRLNPTYGLTRAEMATIFYKSIT